MSRTMDCSTGENRERAIAAAIDAMKAGRLVIMPTDIVYGFGCDAFGNQAVAFLLRAKHRGPDMPVPVLAGSWNTTEGLVREYSSAARMLVEVFWPGGLSLVVNQMLSLPWNLGDTAGTVMLHMSLHPITIEILRRTGPMVVSSANISGQASATNAVRTKQMLGGKVAVYVNDGETTIGTPSTTADISTPMPRILCGGVVPTMAVAEVLSIMPEWLLGQ